FDQRVLLKLQAFERAVNDPEAIVHTGVVAFRTCGFGIRLNRCGGHIASFYRHHFECCSPTLPSPLLPICTQVTGNLWPTITCAKRAPVPRESERGSAVLMLSCYAFCASRAACAAARRAMGTRKGLQLT